MLQLLALIAHLVLEQWIELLQYRPAPSWPPAPSGKLLLPYFGPGWLSIKPEVGKKLNKVKFNFTIGILKSNECYEIYEIYHET